MNEMNESLPRTAVIRELETRRDFAWPESQGSKWNEKSRVRHPVRSFLLLSHELPYDSAGTKYIDPVIDAGRFEKPCR